MSDITAEPMTITVVDRGETLTVGDVQRWIDERKGLLRSGRDMMKDWNGKPVSLYPHYGKLMQIAGRLAEIKAIFDQFNQERRRRADVNIIALVAFLEDPRTMAGIDD